MKKLFLALLISVMLVMSVSLVMAKGSEHKILNKWDLSGSFVAHPGYNWGGLKEGATWDYDIHIKEAVNGDYSVGSIRFTSGDVEVIGHVKQTKSNYAYWAGTNLAASGTAEYNEVNYNFMFLYSNRAIWFAISDDSYDSYWDGETVWPGSKRDYQLHSKVPDETFVMDPKEIH